MNIYCCCSHKVNKLVEIDNEPTDFLPMLTKGNKNADQISKLKFSHMIICCLQIRKKGRIYSIELVFINSQAIVCL